MPKAKQAAEKSARPEWRQQFLDTLGRTSNVTGAARAAGVTVSHAYKTRRAEPGFAAMWFAALCEGYDNLELELLRRLRTGDLEPGSDDKKKTTKRKFDNAIAFRLLAAHRDTVGRERARQDSVDEAETIASINAKLDMMRARIAEASARPEARQGSEDEDGGAS